MHGEKDLITKADGGREIAELIGEKEFSLLFNKGVKENLNLSKFFEDFLLITVFGHDTTLGMLRLRIAGATQKLKTILEQ